MTRDSNETPISGLSPLQNNLKEALDFYNARRADAERRVMGIWHAHRRGETIINHTWDEPVKLVRPHPASWRLTYVRNGKEHTERHSQFHIASPLEMLGRAGKEEPDFSADDSEGCPE